MSTLGFSSASFAGIRLLPNEEACNSVSIHAMDRVGGLVFKAHRLVYHSTLGLRVIKKKKTSHCNPQDLVIRWEPQKLITGAANVISSTSIKGQGNTSALVDVW